MFDTLWPDVAGLACADDATVVAAITDWARTEAAAAARRLAAIAELARRRSGPDDVRARWCCDYWDAAAAEVAAALGVSHGIASGQMRLGVALRERLPRVAALLAGGTISYWLARTIVWRTDLITDEHTLGRVDEALATDAARFGPMSASKTEDAIDAIVDRHDPAALRRTRTVARSREVSIGAPDDQVGTAAVWGRLYATDAALLDRRLMQMAHQVCDDDPRTIAQRRADALGALAAGAQRLACGCANPHCPAGADGDDPRATSVIVHLVAQTCALDVHPDPHMSGDEPAPRPITPDMTLAEALAPDPEPDPPTLTAPAALITGGGVVPAPLLAELIRAGATLRPVVHPGKAAAAESGYRPSAALQRFVRCRDMTCRFPHCDRPAEFCEIDHAVPYPLGPTHPSNLRCLCKKHHLLKTFWTGWRDEQRPDGTIVWTAPSGHTYTTRPGSRLLFPTLCLPTGQLPTAPTQEHPAGDRTIMMPTRRRTRQQDRTHRINTERALNAAHVAERNQPPPF